MEDDSRRRMYQYPNIDGTGELMMGTALLLIGFAGVIAQLPINTELLFRVLPIGIMLLFLGLLWFRQRVTYPRTGYVTPRRPNSFTIGLLVLTFGSMLFKHRLPDDIYLTQEGYPLLFGAFLAVMLLLAGQGLRRFYVYAAVALLMGVGSVAAGLGSDSGMFLTAFVTGTVLTVSGSRILRRYLAEHASPGDA